MNTRRSFLQVLCGAVGSIVALAKSTTDPKASTISTTALDTITVTPGTWTDHPVAIVTNSNGGFNYMMANGNETRYDPDGRVYRRFNGKWVHISTALPEGSRKA